MMMINIKMLFLVKIARIKLNYLWSEFCHLLLDGTMCSLDSANAPEFFMHHGFIDKIWNDWQQKSIVNKYAHFLNINIKMQSSPYYPRDFIDIANQPKCVKVCYDDPTVHKAKQVRAYLQSKHTFLVILLQ